MQPSWASLCKVLSNNQTSQSNMGTGSQGPVHLTKHQRDLRLAIELNDGSLLHFLVQIVVTLTSTLLALFIPLQRSETVTLVDSSSPESFGIIDNG